MAIDRHPGTSSVLAGLSRNPMSLSGTLLVRNNLSAATVDTSEDILLSLPIPRNLLCSSKKALRVSAWFQAAANGNNKVVNMRIPALGAITVTGTQISTTTVTLNNGVFNVNVLLSRVDTTPFPPSFLKWQAFTMVGGGSTGGSYLTGTDLIVEGFQLLITGTTATLAGDLTLLYCSVGLETEGYL